MSVAASDLKVYGAANQPMADTGTVGGAIDETRFHGITQFASAATPQIVSDNAGDTMNVTIEGRNAGGSVISETNALNGTTAVTFSNTFERILKVTIASTASGTVTVKEGAGGTTRITMVSGVVVAQIFFAKSASESGQTIRYEKFFWKNTNGTDTLNAAQVDLTADPATSCEFALEDAKDDNGTSTNRETLPSGIGSFFDDNNAQDVPGSPAQLAAGEKIGVWIKMTRAADAAAVKSTFTTELAGTTT